MRNPYSASQLGRRWLCPGSAKAEAGLPEVETPEAASGTLIHRWAAEKHLSTLSQDDLDRLSDDELGEVRYYPPLPPISEDESDVLRSWLKFRDSVLPSKCFETEVPLSLVDENGNEVTDGTADVVAWTGGPSVRLNQLQLKPGVVIYDPNTQDLPKIVYVLDLKTGYQPQERTSLAFQMSVYMAMAIQKYDADEARAIVYQPRIHKRYDYHLKADEVQDTVRLVQRVIANCERAGLEIRPSAEACLPFCRARHSCPGPRSLAHPLIEQKDLASVPAERLAELWEFWKVVKKQGEALDKLFRAAVREHRMPGYHMKEIKGNRYFPSTREVFGVVKETIPSGEFIEICTVSPAKLEKAYVDRTAGDGVTKAAAEREFAEKTSAVVQRGKPKELITKTEEE